MKEDLADTIVCLAIGLLILIVGSIVFGTGYSLGEDNLIQKLCTRQQYDFCEVIKQKPEYKLKELKQDG
jgi:hypothetical protein